MAVCTSVPILGLGLYLLRLGGQGLMAHTSMTSTARTFPGQTERAFLRVELYRPERLGEVRATVSAATVIASGTAPSLMGWLINAGAPLSPQASACLASSSSGASLPHGSGHTPPLTGYPFTR
jgi:hypothetical protein